MENTSIIAHMAMGDLYKTNHKVPKDLVLNALNDDANEFTKAINIMKSIANRRGMILNVGTKNFTVKWT